MNGGKYVKKITKEREDINQFWRMPALIPLRYRQLSRKWMVSVDARHGQLSINLPCFRAETWGESGRTYLRNFSY